MKRVPAGYDPCTEAYVTNYFNRGDVQRALHANRTRLPYPYSPCRSALRSYCFSSLRICYPLQRVCTCRSSSSLSSPITLASATTSPPPARSSDLGNLRAH